MMAIAAGYEDCDDLDALRTDPAFKIACGRAPESGQDLMSQPTLSRVENLASWRTLLHIGLGMIDLFCKSWDPERIVLDIDDTDDPVHGQQQLALFNAHHGSYCFQPIKIFEAGSGKPVLALLRPGKSPAGKEVARILRHVIARIRKHCPKVAILVRGDSDYCSDEVMTLLESMRCDYILGLQINPKLEAIAAPWREMVAWRRPLGTAKLRRFHQLPYQARRWGRSRRVIARVEATELGTDARFIVTSLDGRAKILYEKGLLRARSPHGEPDQGHEALYAIRQDRLLALGGQISSGSSLHMGANWLLHSLRQAAPRRSPWRGATFETIRRVFVKVAVRVEEIKSRVKLALPATYPYARSLIALTGRLTAQAQ